MPGKAPQCCKNCDPESFGTTWSITLLSRIAEKAGDRLAYSEAMPLAHLLYIFGVEAYVTGLGLLQMVFYERMKFR
jgi:hypothetical protein